MRPHITPQRASNSLPLKLITGASARAALSHRLSFSCVPPSGSGGYTALRVIWPIEFATETIHALEAMLLVLSLEVKLVEVAIEVFLGDLKIGSPLILDPFLI